ncbi:hypothetical protein EYC84_004300 [Monilinia fructicola]|uniref:Uncharacterized protein n=1 Tax=Monilinia fructicola TaxID=38448 RepID=A0A5M9K899_MONFR|nr:hypothetical protein EYC84_004300 [Monilinia fructicola]
MHAGAVIFVLLCATSFLLQGGLSLSPISHDLPYAIDPHDHLYSFHLIAISNMQYPYVQKQSIHQPPSFKVLNRPSLHLIPNPKASQTKQKLSRSAFRILHPGISITRYP